MFSKLNSYLNFFNFQKKSVPALFILNYFRA